ncbi:MAG: putative zinc-binding metallopeptidase [Alistipes finegoldii]
MVHVIGSPAYNENNNIVLGVAEGGKMMTLYQVNIIDYLLSTKNIAQLNELFFRPCTMSSVTSSTRRGPTRPTSTP